MTDEQFKQLMEKLDRIEKEMQEGKWNHLYRPPQPAYPADPWRDGTGFPPHWGPPRITD